MAKKRRAAAGAIFLFALRMVLCAVFDRGAIAITIIIGATGNACKHEDVNG